MESQFAHLRQRDNSVSMLRVKMSRRRSQSQKKNRERVVNTRRQLDKLPEVETTSLNASVGVASVCVTEEKPQNKKPAKSKAFIYTVQQLPNLKTCANRQKGAIKCFTQAACHIIN